MLASIPEDKRARPTLNLDLDELPIERALSSCVGSKEDHAAAVEIAVSMG